MIFGTVGTAFLICMSIWSLWRIQPFATEGTPRHPESLLEWRPVVAILLRLKLWWRTYFHRAPIHRTAADATLKPKDGYAVRAILPRPERRGLLRTGSRRMVVDGMIGYWLINLKKEVITTADFAAIVCLLVTIDTHSASTGI